MPQAIAAPVDAYTDPAVTAFMRLAGNTTADMARLLRMTLVPSIDSVIAPNAGVPEGLHDTALQIAQNGASAAMNAAFNAHVSCALYSVQTDKDPNDIVARLFRSGRTPSEQRIHLINFAAAEIKQEIDDFCSQKDESDLALAFNHAAWQDTVLRTWLMKGLQQTVGHLSARNPLPRDKHHPRAQETLATSFSRLSDTVLAPLLSFQGNLLSELTQTAQDHLRDVITDTRHMMLDPQHPHRSWLAGDILSVHQLHQPLQTASERGLPLCTTPDSKLLGELLMVLEGAHLTLTRGPWRVAIFNRYKNATSNDISLSTPSVKDALTGACTIMGKRLEAATTDLRAQIADLEAPTALEKTALIPKAAASLYAH